MSEYDPNKFYRKKYYLPQRDGSQYNRPYNRNVYKYVKENEKTTEQEIQHPTILQKVRVERSVSPKRKENEISVQIQEVAASPLQHMTKSIKLLEDSNFVTDTVQEYLQDSSDFLVVGILGCQGVGKSTIMNLLAKREFTEELKEELFNYDINKSQFEKPIKILTDNLVDETKTEDKNSFTFKPIKILTDKMDNINLDTEEATKQISTSSIIFKSQSQNHLSLASYSTSGIDLFITDNRVFLLDSQPVISSAVLEDMTYNDIKRPSTPEFLPIENCAEVQSLQLATFLFSVCHVVILVQDWFFDSNFTRFIQTAEMLKPSIAHHEDDVLEHFPHVMLIHNRASLEDFTPPRFKMYQDVYKAVFNKSKLRLDTGMGLGAGKLIRGLNQRTGSNINLFLITDFDDEDNFYRGYPPFEDLIKELRSQIHSVSRNPLISTQLTEKNWLQFANRVWDNIKKSSFFLEYSKLMP